jgi:triosephosphate isomerase
MRKTFIAGNWKMNKTASEAVSLAKELTAAAEGGKHRYLVAPPFTALSAVRDVVKGSRIMLGAQNMSDAEEGAHTGEISVRMLLDLDVEAVILGHSERRHVYGEKDDFINRKVKLALDNKLEVILCVGETLEQREAGQVESLVREQVEKGLEGIPEGLLDRVTIAYEPVWAIGTGKTATPGDADAVHAFIRKVIKELYGNKAAEEIVIQYGGSVKPDNVKELMARENIDGALVGGAALTAKNFVPIMKYDS